jgi:hypothetical protein
VKTKYFAKILYSSPRAINPSKWQNIIPFVTSLAIHCDLSLMDTVFPL